jgi:hypothetical protein
MNATRDPETILTAWLDEGPTDLPGVTRRAILTALPTTQQRGPGPLAPMRFSQMLIYPRLAAAALVTVITVGGAMYLLGQRNPVGGPLPTASPAAPSPTPSPATAASAAPSPVDTSAWIPFTSRFYGFSVSHPSGWIEQPGSGHWSFAKPDDAAIDILWSPSGWPEFTGLETRIPAGKTADAFIAEFTADAVVHACYPPKSLWVQTTVDGHAATIAYAGCNEHFYSAEAIVVIGKRMWFFDLYGPDRSLIVPFLSTVKIDVSAVVD